MLQVEIDLGRSRLCKEGPFWGPCCVNAGHHVESPVTLRASACQKRPPNSYPKSDPVLEPSTRTLRLRNVFVSSKSMVPQLGPEPAGVVLLAPIWGGLNLKGHRRMSPDLVSNLCTSKRDSNWDHCRRHIKCGVRNRSPIRRRFPKFQLGLLPGPLRCRPLATGSRLQLLSLPPPPSAPLLISSFVGR